MAGRIALKGMIGVIAVPELPSRFTHHHSCGRGTRWQTEHVHGTAEAGA